MLKPPLEITMKIAALAQHASHLFCKHLHNINTFLFYASILRSDVRETLGNVRRQTYQ